MLHIFLLMLQFHKEFLFVGGKVMILDSPKKNSFSFPFYYAFVKKLSLHQKTIHNALICFYDLHQYPSG